MLASTKKAKIKLKDCRKNRRAAKRPGTQPDPSGSAGSMKAIMYVRVSSKEQEKEGFSIPAQKKLLQEYAAQNGYKIVKIFEEAETAKKAGRKQFQEMLKFIDTNTDCKDILVEKTDRLYRNFYDHVALDIDRRLLKIHLVKEGQVLSKDSKSHEKLVHDVKLVLSKNYVNNLGEEVKKGQTEKASQGIFPSVAQLGYLNKIDGHTIIVDPNRGPLIRKLFELAATGQYSLLKLKNMIHSQGLRSKRGNTVGKSAIARILKNPMYYGEFVWKGKTYQGTHVPLISKAQFDDVQAKMGFVQKSKVTKREFNFAGDFTCAHCGCSITPEFKEKKSGRTYTYYHCTNGRGVCDSVKYVPEQEIEDACHAALRDIQLTPEIVDWTRQALLESSKDERDFREAAIKTLTTRYQKLDTFISRAYDDKLEGSIEPELWEAKTAEWKREQKEIITQIAAHNRANTAYLSEGVRLMEVSSRAAELFKTMTGDEKREILGLVLSNPQIKKGTLCFHYKIPFNMFSKVTILEKWRE